MKHLKSPTRIFRIIQDTYADGNIKFCPQYRFKGKKKWDDLSISFETKEGALSEIQFKIKNEKSNHIVSRKVIEI